MVTLNRNQVAYLKRCDLLCKPAQKKITNLYKKLETFKQDIETQVAGLQTQINISIENKRQYLTNIGVPAEEVDATIEAYLVPVEAATEEPEAVVDEARTTVSGPEL